MQPISVSFNFLPCGSVNNSMKFAKKSKKGNSSSDSPYSFAGMTGVTAVSSSSYRSRLLATRPPRQVVSLGKCSILCAIFFVAGVVVGHTLKNHFHRWASKLLKRWKKD